MGHLTDNIIRTTDDDTVADSVNHLNVIKLKELIKRSRKMGIQLSTIPVIRSHPKLIKLNMKKINFLVAVSFLLLFCLVIYLIGFFVNYKCSSECIIDMPNELTHAFRPPPLPLSSTSSSSASSIQGTCEFCRNIKEIQRVEQISPQEFEDNFAYTGAPVIITDATANWTALNVFDFWYFKDVYETARKYNRKMSCQFFPYKTEFKNFYEALSIPEERVNYETGTKPWYFGWSNCNAQVAQILRQHYGRPYFLPKTSENNAIDWIFMGGPGLGAHMHVDNVRLPSWQAQIKGEKEWTLAPPPECYYSCSFMKATVRTGEIIVLDTNRWYHKTNVLPGEISITIGAEYD